MKIRLILLLLIALGLTGFLVLFPDVAEQPLRVEVMGWLFETQQGVFIIFLLVLMTVLSLLKRVLFAILSGPGHLWQTLRMGSKNRREQRLRDGIAEWLDMRGDLGAKAFRKSKGVLPDWAIALLQQAVTPAHDIAPEAQDDALLTALRARLATEPGVQTDVATQKQHLQAWLSVHPDAPLAMARLTDLAEQEQDWPTLVELLEANWKSGRNSALATKVKLARAYVNMALEDPESARVLLQKAERFELDDEQAVYAIGAARLKMQETGRVREDWLQYLEKHQSWLVADHVFDLVKADALQLFQSLDKKKNPNASMRWLKARLAHAAKLDGLANELMTDLLHAYPNEMYLLRTKAEWSVLAGKCQEAVDTYTSIIESKGF